MNREGDCLLIGLQLAESGLYGRFFAGWVLQLDDCQRQAVDEKNEVGPLLLLILNDRELVHREKIVVFRAVEINKPDDFAPVEAVPPHRHLDPFGQQRMKGLIPGDQRRRVAPLHLLEGILAAVPAAGLPASCSAGDCRCQGQYRGRTGAASPAGQAALWRTAQRRSRSWVVLGERKDAEFCHSGADRASGGWFFLSKEKNRTGICCGAGSKPQGWHFLPLSKA